MKLTPIEQQIYELVRKRPRTTQELIAQIWWIHPQDAPDPSNIKAHVWHLNQALKTRGERIASQGFRGNQFRAGEPRYAFIYLEAPKCRVERGRASVGRTARAHGSGALLVGA